MYYIDENKVTIKTLTLLQKLHLIYFTFYFILFYRSYQGLGPTPTLQFKLQHTCYTFRPQGGVVDFVLLTNIDLEKIHFFEVCWQR